MTDSQARTGAVEGHEVFPSGRILVGFPNHRPRPARAGLPQKTHETPVFQMRNILQSSEMVAGLVLG